MSTSRSASASIVGANDDATALLSPRPTLRVHKQFLHLSCQPKTAGLHWLKGTRAIPFHLHSLRATALYQYGLGERLRLALPHGLLRRRLGEICATDFTATVSPVLAVVAATASPPTNLLAANYNYFSNLKFYHQ